MNQYETFTHGDFTNIPEENGKLFDRTQDMLIGLQDALYTEGSIVKLEHCLEELCALFEVRFLPNEPMLENKNDVKQIYMHLGYQKALTETFQNKKVG